jgi:hypothetical protein
MGFSLRYAVGLVVRLIEFEFSLARAEGTA